MSLEKLFLGLIVALVSLHNTFASAQDKTVVETETESDPLYIANTYRDWKNLCLSKTGENDPCHMYQLILSDNDHPTAEITLFRVVDEDGISAAGTILAPLKTLLTSKLILTIDNGKPWEYPFSWCGQRGCYVRIAFSDDDILSLKKGKSGTIQIVSITAPTKPIILPFSLLGFTAAFAALE